MKAGRKPPLPRRRIYWDSCLFIDLIQRSGDYLAALDQIVEEAKHDELVLVTSALTLAEVIGQRILPKKKGGPNSPISAEQEQKIIAFFEHEWIAIRPCTGFVGQAAGQIARKYSLKPPDAIHVATALQAEVLVMQTTDGPKASTSLLRKNGKIGTPPLVIELPRAAVQLRLTESEQDDQCEKA